MNVKHKHHIFYFLSKKKIDQNLLSRRKRAIVRRRLGRFSQIRSQLSRLLPQLYCFHEHPDSIFGLRLQGYINTCHFQEIIEPIKWLHLHAFLCFSEAIIISAKLYFLLSISSFLDCGTSNTATSLMLLQVIRSFTF